MLAFAGCRTSPPTGTAEQIRRAQPLLGTFVVISAFGTNAALNHRAVDEAFDAVRRVDSLMSVHRADSELSRLNASAAERVVAVSEELFRVIAVAQDVAQETDGAFDVTIRPVADLWGFIWKQHRFPSDSELRKALASVGHRHVMLDAAQRTVRFTRPGVSIDLGGIAKGYAVDCAIDALRQRGIRDAMVRAGGDLRVMGAPPGMDAWEVRIEDPARRGKRVLIRLRDSAVSTAGNYENFFIVDGRRYSHILNPHTGLPVDGVAACSVVAATCLESDAWSTALFVMGPKAAQARFGGRRAFRFTLMPRHETDARWPVVQSSAWSSWAGLR